MTRGRARVLSQGRFRGSGRTARRETGTMRPLGSRRVPRVRFRDSAADLARMRTGGRPSGGPPGG
jgi:hypothetical protein